ncbi:hypothetical protein OSB04_002770 [Centaurea solstitialis]|uniref:Integrase catalytic domain-containing protein n=1 Tax=Centaurea solstitialis TaxID=347529 RepID=A0AA38TTZ0_9ASTR|nr:hypothetical protein OSB04_002770 [Centaurea solstitialis]
MSTLPQIIPHCHSTLAQTKSHLRSGSCHHNISTIVHPKWLLDSGASHHVTNDIENLSLHNPYDGTEELVIVDGTGLHISHTGSLTLPHLSSHLTLSNVLYVPSISRNIISISKFCRENRMSVEFLPDSFLVKDLKTGASLLRGSVSSGVYELKFNSPTVFASTKVSPFNWHHRLGHPTLKIIKFLTSNFNLNLPSISSLHCTSCACNKSHKIPFSLSTISTTSPLECVYTDLWTSPIPSVDGHKYYIIFLLTITQNTHGFHAIQTSYGKILPKTSITLYSDNGGEYDSLKHYLSIAGVSRLTTPPHTPEHNGYSERRHRHIVETGLSLLAHASMPQKYWSLAFSTAVYLINRLPTATLNNSSSYHRLFHKPPNYLKLRSFGYLCFPWLRPYMKHKLEPKSLPCVFIGYSATQSAYHCLHLPTNRIYTSQNQSNTPTISTPPTSTCPLLPIPENTNPTPPHSPPPPPTRTVVTRLQNNITKPTQKLNLHASIQDKTTEPKTISQALKNPLWRDAMDAEFAALVRNQTWELVPPSSSQNVIDNKWVFRIKYKADGTVEHYKARPVAKGFHQRPGLDYNETFSPVIKPASVRLILSLSLSLSLVVSKGWSLRQLDINNAFLQGTLVDDVYMVEPPGYVDPKNPSYVCKLSKALYGLKQAPRVWYQELRNFLLQSGFKNSIADSSLFILQTPESTIYLLVYVDDIIITGNSDTHLHTFITNLATRFSLKDLGALSYFLGVEVRPYSHGLFLTQQKYICDLLCRSKMDAAKRVATPLATHPPLTLACTALNDPTEYRALVGSLQYLSFTRPDIAYSVNKLYQYMHRPTTDHWQALKRLLRYLRGTLNHGLVLYRDSPQQLHAFSDADLSDADWARDTDDYISTTGYIVYLGRNPISWSSKKQRTCARSSIEAEYRVVATTTAEILWLCNLFMELGLSSSKQPVIYCDNAGTTYVSANPVFHSKMKHLGLDYHFVWENVQTGDLRVAYISNTQQLANILTKPLPRSSFNSIISKIGLFPWPTILQGYDKAIPSQS